MGSEAAGLGIPNSVVDAAQTTVGAVSGQLLAANENRKGLLVQNTGAEIIRVRFGGAATATRGIRLTPGATITLEGDYCPTVAVHAIRESADSTAYAMEIV